MAEDNRSLVIKRSAELEEILKNKFCAEGHGLRELSNSVADMLTLETTEKLSAIAGIRNKAAHEVEFQLYNPEGFIRMCDEAKALLDTIEITERFPSRLESSRRFPSGASQLCKYKPKLGELGERSLLFFTAA